MSNKARLKFFIFIAGLMVLVPVGILFVTLLAQFVAYFQQGADPASIFHGHSLVIPAAEEATWLSVSGVNGVTLSQAQQEEIVAAYWLAWDALDRASETGDISDLPTYWAGGAYEQALAGIAGVQSRSHMGHRLQLQFFSDDGSVAAFEDKTFMLSRQVGDLMVSFEASASITMTLDQGFWRIRSITLDFE